eukprot:1161777-Pelagomonas_calceolata.AAC.5
METATLEASSCASTKRALEGQGSQLSAEGQGSQLIAWARAAGLIAHHMGKRSPGKEGKQHHTCASRDVAVSERRWASTQSLGRRYTKGASKQNKRLQMGQLWH